MGSGKTGGNTSTIIRVRRRSTKRQRKIRAMWAEQKRRDQAEIQAVAQRNAEMHAQTEVRIWTDADL